jgi:predicted GNAT family N-acyltransferase
MLTFRTVRFDQETEAIQAIRYAVFQVEQGVAPELEFDGHDPAAIHLLAEWEQQPVGTARIRQLTPTLAKIERVAVLSTYRNRGIGAQLMQEAIALLQAQNIPTVKINAQLHAQAFYERLGFEPVGDEFEEAGIPHIEMRRSLS